MTTRTTAGRIAATLRRRIRQFYEHFNQGEFEKCYQMIDPLVRGTPACVTLWQYLSSLQRLRDWCGAVAIRDLDSIQLHLDEPNRQYHNRDFALVDITWEDQQGQAHTFKERWVRDGRGRWYTRSTGFVAPG